MLEFANVSHLGYVSHVVYPVWRQLFLNYPHNSSFYISPERILVRRFDVSTSTKIARPAIIENTLAQRFKEESLIVEQHNTVLSYKIFVGSSVIPGKSLSMKCETHARSSISSLQSVDEDVMSSFQSNVSSHIGLIILHVSEC